MAKRKGGRKDLLPIVQDLARQGWSAQKIENHLKEKFGGAYRRQTLKADVREIKTGTKEVSEDVRRRSTPRKYRKETTLPPLETYRKFEAKGERKDLEILNWKNKYNHIIQYEIYNRSTRKREKQHFTVATDRDDLPIEKIEQLAEYLIQKDLARPEQGSPKIFGLANGPKGNKWQLIKRSVKYQGTIERLN
jgi:hypothetical protein